MFKINEKICKIVLFFIAIIVPFYLYYPDNKAYSSYLNQVEVNTSVSSITDNTGFFQRNQEFRENRPTVSIPSPIRKYLREIAKFQRNINNFLSSELSRANNNFDLKSIILIFLISFSYGVLHAGGPGHGKLIVASYFTARESELVNGFIMAFTIALTQAFSAIVIVGILSLILGAKQLEIIDNTIILESVSYILIFLIGLYLLYNSLFSGNSNHSREHHNHEDGHSHGPNPNAKDSLLAKIINKRIGPRAELIVIGIISGIRPCTGSILILLFAAANGVFILGIFSTLMVAFGVALTISIIGFVTIFFRRSISGNDSGSKGYFIIGKLLSIIGSSAVVLIGLSMFGASLERSGLLG